ncbi:MAG: thermonuclease family protein [Rhizobiaceae bacterium]|nr:thermonuclease family protein [Rhizobiaceae bacterium]
MTRHPATIVFGLVSVLAGPAQAETFEGPVAAKVLDVLDGDTFLAEALVWPGQFIRVNVRLRGVDAPEMKARCAAEKIRAEEARAALSELLGPEVLISNIGGAKYYGRVLADVRTRGGVEVAGELVATGLARPYQGGRRQSWCG